MHDREHSHINHRIDGRVRAHARSGYEKSHARCALRSGCLIDLYESQAVTACLRNKSLYHKTRILSTHTHTHPNNVGEHHMCDQVFLQLCVCVCVHALNARCYTRPPINPRPSPHLRTLIFETQLTHTRVRSLPHRPNICPRRSPNADELIHFDQNDVNLRRARVRTYCTAAVRRADSLCWLDRGSWGMGWLVFGGVVDQNSHCR